MHSDHTVAGKRIDRVLRERLLPALYTEIRPCEIGVWQVSGEPVPAEQALQASYRPAGIGHRWGPPWGTTWFRITGDVPKQWSGLTVEAVVDLGFEADRPGFQCEGLVYLPDGSPVKGLHPRSNHIPVPGEGMHTWYIEAAANPLILGPRGFQPTSLGDPATASVEPLYELRTAQLAVLNTEVWQLLHDTEVLVQLMRELDPATGRWHDINRALQVMLDRLDLADVTGTAETARQELAAALGKPAHASAHRLAAIGHAHIDSAWLWPLRETVRKVARTTASVTALMHDHPGFRFAMSQAQQLAWIKQQYPTLFERIRKYVHTGQFVPVGGMWVEADTNLPGGEAMARQFVHGKRFYLDEFGIETREVWLPDSFGYSAALPQLVVQSGSRWFLTQKLSWNQTNTFPHHTFWWEGIDGTRLFTHFPPADTYNAELTGAELAHASRTFSEHGYATSSLIAFGHGDGGGGPTRDMLARAKRTQNLEGSPRVTLATPAEFFTEAETEHPGAAVWSGELYLEMHRGTYTSQLKTKQGNRHSEHLLREAELWCATAAVAGLMNYPYDALDELWKTVLLHQFHDILPGSSIAWVHRDAQQAYERVGADLEDIIGTAQKSLAGTPGEFELLFNATPHARNGVAAMAADTPRGQYAPSAESLDDGTFALRNELIQATVDDRGLLVSVVDKQERRELIPAGQAANLLQLHPDHPAAWDAWDLDRHYRNTSRDLTAATSVTVVQHHDLPAVRVERAFGRSTVTQWMTVSPGSAVVAIDTEIDWQEEEKILKAAFPLDIHADRSASETQFGHVFRPTHTNTSWDAAKFEICAHRWLHVAESGYGIAVVNDSTYGHDVTRDTREGGGTTTTVRLSLLRAPRFPDPHTDQGPHRLRYALVAAPSIGDAIREGYRINLPERNVSASRTVAPLVQVSGDAIIAEAVKLADDKSGDVIVRLYESRGGRAEAVLRTSFAVAAACRTDLLERPTGTVEAGENTVPLKLRPFEIVTLRLSPLPFR